MEEKERKTLYRKVLAINGYMGQMHVAIEEMAELMNALVKKERGRATDDDVIGEIADVIICMEQLARYFGVDKCVAAKLRKLRRLEARLETYLRQQERKEQANVEGGGETTACGEPDEDEQPCTAADGDDNMLND